MDYDTETGQEYGTPKALTSAGHAWIQHRQAQGLRIIPPAEIGFEVAPDNLFPLTNDPAFDRLTDDVPNTLKSVRLQVESLNEMNLMQTEIRKLQNQLALRQARDAVASIQDAAREIALESIERGEMSRVQAAEMLGVHQGTVAKWLKDRKQQN